MGPRMVSLQRIIAVAEGACLAIVSSAAVMQRLPPPLPQSRTALRVCNSIDVEALASRLRKLGCLFEDRVDDPGEAAFRGGLLDLYPPDDALPSRVEFGEGTVVSIRRYDPLTQRSVGEVDAVRHRTCF